MHARSLTILLHHMPNDTTKVDQHIHTHMLIHIHPTNNIVCPQLNLTSARPTGRSVIFLQLNIAPLGLRSEGRVVRPQRGSLRDLTGSKDWCQNAPPVYTHTSESKRRGFVIGKSEVGALTRMTRSEKASITPVFVFADVSMNMNPVAKLCSQLSFTFLDLTICLPHSRYLLT